MFERQLRALLDLSDTASLRAERSDGRFSGKAAVTRRRARRLLVGELSSATSGSLTVALRAAASELRGTGLLVPAGTSVSKHRRPRQAPLRVLA